MCGVDENQQARCWNSDNGQDVLKLPGKYKNLSIGEGKVVCGVHTDGTITCTRVGARVSTPPELSSKKATAVAMNYEESIGFAILVSKQPNRRDWNENANNPQTWPDWGTTAK